MATKGEVLLQSYSEEAEAGRKRMEWWRRTNWLMCVDVVYGSFR